ncbi:hypothetical protein EMIHUDRAFT_237144 [Emiliania huxleyi CCMP1516]|uniref:Myb-like domain-containing protein n=2 Tax=Emiliania huxleyi TaxID=2903 RepID=A0A0D3JRI2_EMIH1|nr:hypothetical protein EMIHUDRAFT_237144 [Emiliania huxleyi CCMP1516]EOD26117.1 hypothetical protein EMIHUDRAFT_237144 [Emiliania huxleyi CCMP1516]|eukprot:XP_005778546.1 hypothetical protein EMIHUDRAFT_237144 [Emiliania huxleyi CCMP1516]
MPAGPTQRRFSAAEDAAVLAAFDELGPKWGLIAQRLPGRTEAAVKSRYFRRRAAEERSLSSALNSLLQEDDPTASGQQWSRLIGGLDGTGEAAAGAAVDGGGDSDDSMGAEPATPMELGPAHASPPDTAPLEARSPDGGVFEAPSEAFAMAVSLTAEPEAGADWSACSLGVLKGAQVRFRTRKQADSRQRAALAIERFYRKRRRSPARELSASADEAAHLFERDTEEARPPPLSLPAGACSSPPLTAEARARQLRRSAVRVIERTYSEWKYHAERARLAAEGSSEGGPDAALHSYHAERRACAARSS